MQGSVLAWYENSRVEGMGKIRGVVPMRGVAKHPMQPVLAVPNV